MDKKIRKFLFTTAIIDALTIVLFLLLKTFHNCHDDDCLVCSFISGGLTFALVIAILIMLFPILYSFKLPILRVISNHWYKNNENLKSLRVYTILENSLVNLFIRIQ